jgi:hypothetical protein
MINFVEYVGREVNFRKGLRFKVDEIPSSVLREIDAGRKVGIWWFQSAEDSSFKVVARTVLDRYHLSHASGLGDFAFVDVDLSESYACLSTLGQKVSVKMPELVLAGQRLHQIDDLAHSVIACSVRNCVKISLSKTKGNDANRQPGKVGEALAARTREVFSRVFERNINEPFYSRRQDTHDRISGPGIAVLESLVQDHRVDPGEALDAVLSLDPICKDILHPAVPFVSPEPETPVERTDVTFTPPPPREDSVEWIPDPYLELTDEALAARTYSDPLNFHEGMAATQRAEDVHQAILKSITQCLRAKGGYRILYNKFADLALAKGSETAPRHVIEIKSITLANIESQFSKGLIQLSRLQFAHKGAAIHFHLVAEGITSQPPEYLRSLAERLDVSLHRFDFGASGLSACKTLYDKLYDSNGSPQD